MQKYLNKESLAIMKKDTVKLICALLSVLLIPALLITVVVSLKDKAVIKPHIFYNGSAYCRDAALGEYSLNDLNDTLIQDGTIDTLLDDTEVCYDDYQTNREAYLNARIYRLKTEDQSMIYLQTFSSSDTLLLFRQEK